MYTKTGLFLLTCLFSGGLLSQQMPEVHGFRAQHSGGVVYLEWTMRSGSICNGISVTRSEDSLNFTQIGSIAGLCGSVSAPVLYRFQDPNPIGNTSLYYRLELGTVGQSNTISLFVPETGFGEYQIFPNPFSANSRLYFFNPRAEQFHLRIFDVRGQAYLSAETTGDNFALGNETLKPGLYYFILYMDGSEAGLVKGNFMVLQN